MIRKPLQWAAQAPHFTREFSLDMTGDGGIKELSVLETLSPATEVQTMARGPEDPHVLANGEENLLLQGERWRRKK